jgi:hypothetical protein
LAKVAGPPIEIPIECHPNIRRNNSGSIDYCDAEGLDNNKF